MSKIKQVFAREVLNSKGIPTIETTIVLADNTISIAQAPGRTSESGAQAAELIDSDTDRFGGHGVLKAVDAVINQIGPKLVGMDVTRQREIDKLMIDLDGTQNKSRLGSNSMISVSIAAAKAGARSSVLPLYLYLRQFINKEHLSLKIPTPCFNVLNGGKITGGNLDFQSVLLIPASSKPYSEALQMGVNIYGLLRKSLETQKFPTLVGDEGGFGPNLSTNEEALFMIKQAVENTSYRIGFDAFLGVDCSSNNFYQDGKYKLKDSIMQLSSSDVMNYFERLNEKFHILYLEDPLFEEDWEGWAELCMRISHNTLLVGDHLTSTNPYRLQMAIDKKAITGITIKPSQIGTVVEALAVVEVARQAGLKVIVSSTSADTVDDFISDFAVAVSSDYVKFGAPARGENTVKYNRLLDIEAQVKTI